MDVVVLCRTGFNSHENNSMNATFASAGSLSEWSGAFANSGFASSPWYNRGGRAANGNLASLNGIGTPSQGATYADGGFRGED